jgi:replicative DNA helicase
MNALAKPENMHHLAQTAAEAERIVLGACLSYDGATHTAMAALSEEHFGEAVHAVIWKAMVSLASEGKPVNPVTLGVLLGNEAVAPGYTMRQYLAHLAADTSCPAAYVLDAAKQVRDFWALRSVIARCEQANLLINMPGARPRDLIADLIQELDSVRAVLDGRKTTGRSIGEWTAELTDRVDRQRAGEIIEETVSTGLQDLDKKLGGGFHPGELIVVAGRPGMGKSLLGVSLARQMSKAGFGGGIFSLEMPGLQVNARMVSDTLYSPKSFISASQILQNDLTDHQAESIHYAEREMRSLPLLVDDSSSLTIGEISARVRAWRSRFERVGKRLQFIVIDYLKFLRASERYRGQRHYEVGEITAGLKMLAKDLGIAVILLVQLNREVEKRAEKRPELSDLRESGDIEADADVVLLLYREAYYLAMADDPRQADVANDLEIIIAKQRMGPTGSLRAFCHVASNAVRDVMRGYS